MLAHIEM